MSTSATQHVYELHIDAALRVFPPLGLLRPVSEGAGVACAAGLTCLQVTADDLYEWRRVLPELPLHDLLRARALSLATPLPQPAQPKPVPVPSQDTPRFRRLAHRAEAAAYSQMLGPVNAHLAPAQHPGGHAAAVEPEALGQLALAGSLLFATFGGALAGYYLGRMVWPHHPSAVCELHGRPRAFPARRHTAPRHRTAPDIHSPCSAHCA